MFNSLRMIWMVLIGAAFCASNARAQVDNRLAVGMSVTARVASSSGADGSADVGFELRLGHERDGWGWQYSFFNWFDTGVRYEPVAGRTIDLGQLRLRPMMAGYGYTRLRGRAAVTADVIAGYAFNSFELDAGALADYRNRLGATAVESKATNAFVVKPEAQVWYDLSPRIGLKVSGGYLIARPSVTVTTSLGEDRRSVDADTFLITFGLVYSIF
jgi:hypothetical protein